MSIFAVPVLNVLWEMVAGHSFKREDLEVQKILKMMNWVFTSKVDYQKDERIFIFYMQFSFFWNLLPFKVSCLDSVFVQKVK